MSLRMLAGIFLLQHHQVAAGLVGDLDLERARQGN
jgi:hypothetical protein